MTLDRKNLILLTIAALSAILAAWAVRSWISAQEPKVVAQPAKPAPQVVSSVEVLVASDQMPAGLIVNAENLKWQKWPEAGLSDAYITRESGNLEDFTGSVTREAIAKGEPISASKLVKPGDHGFLAAVLQPGMRAITIPINANNSIAGLLFPGDHVDLLVTHQVTGPGGAKRRVTETVMTNVRVIAVDARTQSADGKPVVGKSITVELAPKQVEQVVVARGIGSFSVALRSLASTEVAANDSPDANGAKLGNSHTWDSDVSHLISGGGAQQQQVVIMRGTKTTSQKFQQVTK